MKINPRLTKFLKRGNEDDSSTTDGQSNLQRTATASSYMQRKRNIFVNVQLPTTEFDAKGRQINHQYATNRVQTAKYTPINFIPKNLFEQFRNVANLYFLFLVILQCIPLFGVTEPAVSALPLIVILIITAIKDGIEDWKRSKSDDVVNNSHVLTLSNWRNVNIPEIHIGSWYRLYVIIGYLSILCGAKNKYATFYRQLKKVGPTSTLKNDQPNTSEKHLSDARQDTSSPKALVNSIAKRSNTVRSTMSSMFNKNQNRNSNQSNVPLRNDVKPDLERTSTVHSSHTFEDNHQQAIDDVPKVNLTPAQHMTYDGSFASQWNPIKWKDLQVGDFVFLNNDDPIPADIAILSTSENDNVCYIETQNLDGETNLKQRQGLKSTKEFRTEKDCTRAKFWIESEPPHVNIYQYNGVLRWQMDDDYDEDDDNYDNVEAITYNNILLRGCVLRNTQWIIGIVVYTGNETKIMLNTGKTPSKRSKMAKATNPHVIANFVILAILCIVSSIIDSVQFYGKGSAHLFDFNIEGTSGAYSGFVTFWVTLILYQNIVPISLYISVEIVKTLAAYFIYSDLDMYYAETDTPCIPKTWNISDDLGQIEYIFSDKTGTLTQNVMEYRKCTINGVSYGMGSTEASLGALKRQQTNHTEYSTAGRRQTNEFKSLNQATDVNILSNEELESLKQQMFEKQTKLFDNPHVGSNPTFVDIELFDDLAKVESEQAKAISRFFECLALCHTVIANRNEEHPDFIDYKAESPDEAALVATARDMGFVFLGRDSNKLLVKIKGEEKSFTLLNVLEFNSTRKRMSVILKSEDSDEILLLCKGADSIIYERLRTDFGDQLDLKKKQDKLKESTSQDLETFANEGLRTLCLAYRMISAEDYRIWNKKFQEAASSIHDREEKVDEVGEEIEQELLLMGGTAIEDRLQIGVPETIAELAKSGIKIWVLTGDKTETAINIGFSCNLLTTDMELLILRADNREIIKTVLNDALTQLKDNDDPDKKFALVIDGSTLKYALEDSCKDMLLAIGTHCASVICCRVSPKQKALVVRMVKKGLKVMTLAIGDGANDVSMIQEANVGIGISGVEGRQAVMASDYAIAQFRFLRKLLLVHGRWSYLRTAEMIMGFFFKNIVWTFVLFWYQIFCQFNGSMMFDYALITLYNLIFTSLPIIFLGIWDQDLSAKISLKYPQLYRMGLRNDKFKVWRFWLTVFDAIFQSSVCFFFPYMLLIGGGIDPKGYDANGMYEIGTVISSIVVCIANIFVAVSLNGYTWIQFLVISLSILVYFAFVGVYAQFNTFIFAGHIRMFGTGSYWLVFILAIVACYIPRISAKHFLGQYYPYDNDIIREIELVKKKKKNSDYDESTFVDIDNDIASTRDIYSLNQMNDK